jgi:hypothetical protein
MIPGMTLEILQQSPDTISVVLYVVFILTSSIFTFKISHPSEGIPSKDAYYE